MIRWIQDHRWLPGIYLAISTALIFGGADLILQGWQALVCSLIISAGLVFARSRAWLTVLAVVAGTAVELLLHLYPLVASLSTSFAVFLIAAFATPLWRQISVIVANLVGFVVSWQIAYGISLRSTVYGVYLANDNGRLAILAVGAILVVAINSLAWLLGRLLITRLLHVGTELDQSVVQRNQLSMEYEIADQSARLVIANDVTGVAVQRMASLLSVADGARFGVKANPAVAEDAFGRISRHAREAQTELRRLQDLLVDSQEEMAVAPPRLDAIDSLLVTYRRAGFGVNYQMLGEPFELGVGASQAVYRLIYEAFESVVRDNPSGTTIWLEVSWATDGLQVLVKDDGLQVLAAANSFADDDDQYTIEDDLAALVEVIETPAISAMRQRARLYEGTVEATRLPGVGYTISLIFPTLRAVGSSANVSAD